MPNPQHDEQKKNWRAKTNRPSDQKFPEKPSVQIIYYLPYESLKNFDINRSLYNIARTSHCCTPVSVLSPTTYQQK